MSDHPGKASNFRPSQNDSRSRAIPAIGGDSDHCLARVIHWAETATLNGEPGTAVSEPLLPIEKAAMSLVIASVTYTKAAEAVTKLGPRPVVAKGEPLTAAR